MTSDPNCTNCRFAVIRGDEYFCIAFSGTPIGVATEVILEACEKFEEVRQ